MTEPFLGEIKFFGFDFAPRGWAMCNGQLLPISQNQALFSILGTTYGGDGRTSFALPDLRGRTPVHKGAGLVLGERSGQEQHTLISSELPVHTHVALASSDPGSTPIPTGNVLAGSAPNELYHAATNPVGLRSETIGPTGGGQPHSNMQPYAVLNFCIALQGIFPSRS